MSAECCVCLDEFTSPASLPCGHRFCLSCIGEYWRALGSWLCPLCKTSFPIRPQLEPDRVSPAPGPPAQTLKPGEVPCDQCWTSYFKNRAVKSCLQCLASYCAVHLEPHYRGEELGRHLLVNLVKNLEEAQCRLHAKQLIRFCRSDRTLVCAMCARTEHRGHHLVSVRKEAAKKKIKLKWKLLNLHRAVQEKLDLSVDVSLNDSRHQRKDLIVKMEEEIATLRGRIAELEQLLYVANDDHDLDDLRFLQRCIALESQTTQVVKD